MQRRGSLNGVTSSRIRVAVRVRPPDAKIPKDSSRPPCVAPHAHAVNAVAYQHEDQAKAFTFDHVFAPDATQEDVYANALQPLMAQFLDGFNVTVMAYGQTGSGKTYTMGNKATIFNTTPTTSPSRERASSLPAPTIAVPEVKNFQGSPEDGLMPRFLNDLFVNLKKEPSIRDIRVTFVEIYCDTIRDLLDDRVNKTLTIRDDSHNVWVENVRSIQVETLPRALEVLNAGRARQTVGVNALNDESSRSHAVYTMEVTRKFQSETKKSKVTFVDLAGSERLKKTQVEGVRKRESIQINMGLSALGNVINALADEKKMQRRCNQDPSSRPSSPDAHIPYRSSKLTRLLRDGLGGNARTLFIACVSPLDSNADETLITLQFANRARNIQNKAEKCVHAEPIVVVPVSPKSLEVGRLQEEIKLLTAHIEELELSARRRDEEFAASERERMLRKQREVEDRRDVEMTTEITIFPQIDAHTQFEGESTEEQRDKFVDISTLTEVVDELFHSPKDAVDASVQTEWKSSSVEADVMTDPVSTSESWTDCYGLHFPLVDSGVQVYPAHAHLSDVQLEPERLLVAEYVDRSTDPLHVDCGADSGTETGVNVSVDVEASTDVSPTMDACTQSDVFLSIAVETSTDVHDVSDIATQSEAVTSAEVETSTDLLSVVDAATQPNSPVVVEVETNTDVTSIVDMDTQCELLRPVDVETNTEDKIALETSTQSDINVSIDVETNTEVTETVEIASQFDVACANVQIETEDSQAVDAASQCDTPGAIYVDKRSENLSRLVNHEFVALPRASDISAERDITPLLDSSTGIDREQDEVLGIDTPSLCCVGVAEPASNRISTTWQAFTFVGVVGEEGIFEAKMKGVDAENSTDIDPNTVACGISTSCAPVCLSDAAAEIDSSSDALRVPAVAIEEPPALSRTSQATSSISAYCPEMAQAVSQGLPDPVISECVQNEGNDFTEPNVPGHTMHEEDPTPAPSNDIPVTPTTRNAIPSKQISCTKELITSDQFLFEKGSISKIQALGSAAQFECPRIVLFDDPTTSTKASGSLTPELLDEDTPKDSRDRSENQLETGEFEPFNFVCSPIEEDDLLYRDNATRSALSSCVFAYGDFSGDPTRVQDTRLPALPASARSSLADTNLKNQDDHATSQCDACAAPKTPPDFVVVRSQRTIGDNQRSPYPSPRWTLSRCWLSSPCHQTVRPLRMFTFDDDVATGPSEKTAARAMGLYEELRQIAEDEFGSTMDVEGQVEDPLDYSPVTQLIAETEQFIDRRSKQQQRIGQLRRRVLSLEEVLRIQNRAPISEPELKAYSLRVQEDFLGKLVEQLVALAAERLHTRLKARIEAEQSVPLSSHDDDPSSPFLSFDQCQACAEWFFHRPTDSAYFDKQIMPLVRNGWISLTPEDLECEQAWFQL